MTINRSITRLGATAIGVGLIASVAFASPASAAPGIVDTPAAPVADTVSCNALNTAAVATPEQFSLAYVNPLITCINMTSDITFVAGAPFTGSLTALDRSVEINGGGNTLTFEAAAAWGNRPFYLKNQATDDAGKVIALRNMEVNYGYDAYLVSGEAEQGRGWDIVLDDVTLDGVAGWGVGEPAGRPVSSYLSDVFLEGTGDATNTYGRFFPRNIVIEPGADWDLAPTAAGASEPQLDMSYGLTYGPAGQSGKVWVLGDLDVDGGAFSAIWSFAGVYVGPDGALSAHSDYNGYSYGALTTAGGTAGTGQVWVDDGGTLSVTNENGIAIYAIAGAPLDLRSDPGSSVTITGSSDPSWPASLGIGAITMASGGSSLQFNDPAELDITNLGNTATNNWAISTLLNAGSVFDYSLAIYDAQQVATWLHSTPVGANPNQAWSPATLITDATGLALAGSGPADLLAEWDTTDYRRIWAGDTELFAVPAINPWVLLSTGVVGLGVVTAVVAVRRRQHSAKSHA